MDPLATGRRAQAVERLRASLEKTLELDFDLVTMFAAETWALLVGLHEPLLAARLLGANATLEATVGAGDTETDKAQDEPFFEAIRAGTTPDAWDAAFDRGRSEELAGLLREAAAVPVGDPS